MKLISTSILFLLFVTQSFALSITDEGTPFETISAWQKNAASVLYNEVADSVYIGKCFTLIDQEKPLSGALVITHKEVGGDRGPAFPPKSERKAIIFSIWYGGKDSLIQSALDNWSIANLKLTSEFSKVEFDQENITGEVKRFQEYLTLVARTNRDIHCTSEIKNYCNAGETLKKGTTSYACYFYEKLK